jgi:hypothetical protein
MELAHDAISIVQTHGREFWMFERANLRKMRDLDVETAATEQPEGAVRRSDADNVVRRRHCSALNTGVIVHQRSFDHSRI